MSYPSKEARGVPPWLSDAFRHTSPATVPQYTCFFRNFKCFFALFLDKYCTCCRLLAADRPDRPSPCAAFLYMKNRSFYPLHSLPEQEKSGSQKAPALSASKKPRRVPPPGGGGRKYATARFPPRGVAAAAYAANMPPAYLLTLRRRKNTLRGASVAGPVRGRGASAANPLWRKRR